MQQTLATAEMYRARDEEKVIINNVDYIYGMKVQRRQDLNLSEQCRQLIGWCTTEHRNRRDLKDIKLNSESWVLTSAGFAIIVGASSRCSTTIQYSTENDKALFVVRSEIAEVLIFEG